MNTIGFAMLPTLTLLIYFVPIGLACYLMILAIKALKIYIANNQNDYRPKF